MNIQHACICFQTKPQKWGKKAEQSYPAGASMPVDKHAYMFYN